MATEFTVWVDHREDAKLKPKLIKALSKIEGCQAEDVQLPVGDVICGDVAIERKAPRDLTGSMTGGYVLRQLMELRENYTSPILVIHGDMYDAFTEVRGNARNLHRSYLGLLATVARMGIPTVPCRNDLEYVEFVKALVRQSDPNRPASERPILTRKPKNRTVRDEQEDVVCAISGIGRKTARSLLLKYKSPMGMFTADKVSLVDVDGIGGKTADHIIAVGTEVYVDDEVA